MVKPLSPGVTPINSQNLSGLKQTINNHNHTYNNSNLNSTSYGGGSTTLIPKYKS